MLQQSLLMSTWNLEGHSINAILPSLSTVYSGSSVNIISHFLYIYSLLWARVTPYLHLFCQIWVKLGVTLYSILANAMVGGGHLDCARSDCYAGSCHITSNMKVG